MAEKGRVHFGRIGGLPIFVIDQILEEMYLLT